MHWSAVWMCGCTQVLLIRESNLVEVGDFNLPQLLHADLSNNSIRSIKPLIRMASRSPHLVCVAYSPLPVHGMPFDVGPPVLPLPQVPQSIGQPGVQHQDVAGDRGSTAAAT